MQPPFKKTTLASASERVLGAVPALAFVMRPISQKIFKPGPFELSMVTAEHTYFSQLLARLVREIKELPDFADDKRIAVMTDFGGEHPTASFYTYSFLFLAADKGGPFVKQVQDLRAKHQLLAPYSEFAYKRLKHGPRSRALPKYLELVDNFIHGAIITVAIDKSIDTVFGLTKRQTHPHLVDQLLATQLGTWDGHAAEKALRVCHMLAAFLAVLSGEKQELLWYCDNDRINEDGKERSFLDLQKMLCHVLGLYMAHSFTQVRFGKSLENKSFLDDLLSVPDLAAGVIQDLLQAHHTGVDNIPGGDEKIPLIRWTATPSKFLSKITLQIVRTEDGGIGTGIVDIVPAAEGRKL
ncbi:hypothetical protein KDW49_26620 [Burkholderia dolosa]|uniref:hypothetical protein n=1 Tax=Burkholderia dolosa TaxID=152500 RepID=UPI001B970CCA|nr:hypothetical protein [Burkholderia dolosa]MBR8304290.1 hypothetical protein [Burkholderia dolosa]